MNLQIQTTDQCLTEMEGGDLSGKWLKGIKQLSPGGIMHSMMTAVNDTVRYV